MLFQDSFKTLETNKDSVQRVATSARANVYPLESVTKVAFNPNRNSYAYLASGYQAGLVRISYLGFLCRYRTPNR